METKYEHDFKIELRKVLKRWFYSSSQVDLTTPVSAPLLLNKLKNIHLPLDGKTERRLSLRFYKLSVEELLGQLSFDTLLRSWRIGTQPLATDLPLRFSEQPTDEDRSSLHNVKTQIEDSKLDGSSLSRGHALTLRTVELPSLLSSPHSTKTDLHHAFPLDQNLEELRSDLSSLLHSQYPTPLGAFLQWDKNHVRTRQDFKLSYAEFKDGLRKVGMKLVTSEAEALYSLLDSKHAGLLTFKEFSRIFEDDPRTHRPQKRTVRKLRDRLTPQAFSCFRLPVPLE